MFPPDAARRDPVVVFDGVCVLCNGWVRFLMARRGGARFRFAAMQGPAGRALLARHGVDPGDPASFLFLHEGRARTDSDGVIAVFETLGGGWRLASALRVVPRAWRDAAYRVLARNRYRWFGRHAACAVPHPDARDRFLDA